MFFSCSLIDGNISREDDNVIVEYDFGDSVSITNKTERDIIIFYVMSDSYMALVDMAPPLLSLEVNLPASSTEDFEIDGIDEVESSLSIMYYFKDSEDLNSDNIPDETFDLEVEI